MMHSATKFEFVKNLDNSKIGWSRLQCSRFQKRLSPVIKSPAIKSPMIKNPVIKSPVIQSPARTPEIKNFGIEIPKRES